MKIVFHIVTENARLAIKVKRVFIKKGFIMDTMTTPTFVMNVSKVSKTIYISFHLIFIEKKNKIQFIKSTLYGLKPPRVLRLSVGNEFKRFESSLCSDSRLKSSCGSVTNENWNEVTI